MIPAGRRWRAFAPGAAAAHPRVRLDPEEAHHLARVLRARPGDRVDVFDGAGREWRGTYDGDGIVNLHEELADPVEPPIAITLLQAGSRPERFEWVLQKGTEIGIVAFRWLATARVEPAPPSPARLERWRRILAEAAKQSGRRVVPTLDLEAAWPRPPAAATGLVLDPGGTPLGESLGGSIGNLELAVGPEGGFEAEEIASLRALGWGVAGLGPRILRTETAGPLAAALVLHDLGDLGPPARPVDSGEPRP